ncbi:NAD(P)/FAD-dependent oxidoreductase [Actinorugispora endophytica]|uniref:NAD(P)/FAD-dependent oxidoreductase n=1 Tax=Actinorugispora endophytica TaxID=1605990 RepID=UPI001FB69ACC|nr:FAD-dependent oxidoreductase [Actinorugispora endophytica]
MVIGAGYSGLAAAGRAARRAGTPGAEVTLVNAAPHFVERVRLHQLAAGQEPRERPLRDALRGSGAELVVGRVTGLDPGRREVLVDTGAGSDSLPYDTLVYALGSAAGTGGVPGAAEHALSVSTGPEARRSHARIAGLASGGGSVAVVGGGLTGVEAAAELAESHPGLRVRLLTSGEPGAALSERGRRHLDGALERLGVDVRANSRVVRVDGSGLTLADGASVPADAVLWSTGFAVPDIAERAGLAVDASGRVLVDERLRAVSDPDVYAVGDAALVTGPSGIPLRMACATGLPMGLYAADAITGRLAGREPAPFRFRYYAQCVSLGRRDGLIQFVDADDTARESVLTGRAAARVKEAVVRGAAWAARNPGPYTPRARRARSAARPEAVLR